MYEIHPNTRPFDNGTKYEWRTQDILNTIASSKFVFKHLEEIYDDGYGAFWVKPDEDISKFSEDEIKELLNWKTNLVSAIPQ